MWDFYAVEISFSGYHSEDQRELLKSCLSTVSGGYLFCQVLIETVLAIEKLIKSSPIITGPE